MAKLLIQESNGAREFELVDLEVNIGRELDNALRLSDPSISRHHAVIRQSDGGHEIQDLSSSNGVLINGNRIQATPLQDGDRITLGQLQLTYVNPRLAQAQPMGTVRMNPEELKKLQGASTREMTAPTSLAPLPGPEASPLPPEPRRGGILGFFARLGRKGKG